MSDKSSKSVTPGGSGGPPATPPSPPKTPASGLANIASLVNPKPGKLGDAMYCKSPALLAQTLGPMIASQLGLDEKELKKLLVLYFASHGIANDKCLAAVHANLPDPKANTGNQGSGTLTLPSTEVLRKIARGVHLAVGKSLFLQKGTTYEELFDLVGATTNPGNISGAQALRPRKSSGVTFSESSRIPKVSVPSYTKYEPDDSEQFLERVQSAFESEGAGDYLTDSATCTQNLYISKAFCSRILHSFSDSPTQRYLKEEWNGYKDVSLLWTELVKHFRHPQFKRSARGKLWDRLLRLECTDFNDFTRWYSDINEIVSKLTNLKSQAVTDEELLCSFVGRGLDVEELKEEQKKFLKPSTVPFKDMLSDLREDYRAQKGKEEASTATANTKRATRRAKQTADSKPISFPTFPRNRNNVVDPAVYAQLKAFYSLAIKEERTAAEQKEVDNFTLEPAPSDSKWKKNKPYDRGDRDRGSGGGNRKPPRDSGRRSDKRRSRDDYGKRSSRRSYQGRSSRSRDRSYSRSRSPSRSPSRDRRDRSRSRSRSHERSSRRSSHEKKRRASSRSPSVDNSRSTRRTMFSGKPTPDGNGGRKNK